MNDGVTEKSTSPHRASRSLSRRARWFLFSGLTVVAGVMLLVAVTPLPIRIVVYFVAVPIAIVVLMAVSATVRQLIARWKLRKHTNE